MNKISFAALLFLSTAISASAAPLNFEEIHCVPKADPKGTGALLTNISPNGNSGTFSGVVNGQNYSIPTQVSQNQKGQYIFGGFGFACAVGPFDDSGNSLGTQDVCGVVGGGPNSHSEMTCQATREAKSRGMVPPSRHATPRR